MISHVIVLSGLHHRPTWSNQSLQLSFVFNIDCIYLISHVVILSSIHHSWDSIHLVTIVQYHFQHKLHLYDRSHHCLVQFSSQKTTSLIGHENLVSFSTQTLSVQLVMQLSYLVFVIVSTRFDRSRKFNIIFEGDRTFTISHVIFLLVFVINGA